MPSTHLVIKARCERCQNEWWEEAKPLTPSGKTLWMNCRKCGRGYEQEEDGEFYSDRPLTILQSRKVMKED